MNYSTKMIHLIPFDLGYVFYDELAIDNKQAFLFAERFVNSLKNIYGEKLTNNFYINKAGEIHFINKKISRRTICYVKLTENLYCYIQTSGVGMFVLFDFDEAGIPENLKKQVNGKKNIVIKNAFQKVYSQELILGNVEKDKTTFSNERALMKQFKIDAWQVAKKECKKNEQVRKISSNINYKFEGFSYVLTIYLLNKNNSTPKNVNSLLYSLSNNNVIKQEKWDGIIAKINSENLFEEDKIEDHNAELHFSWSAVAIYNNIDYNCFQDVFDDSTLCALIKSEIYVQSRWFIADITLDNIHRESKELEKLSRLKCLVSIIDAELENDISANMTSLYKKCFERIVVTSDIKNLCKSTLRQLDIQIDLKNAKDKEYKKRNSFIINLFMAVFTAASLYKTIVEMHNSTTGIQWKNILIFAVTFIIAIGVVIINYITSKE